MRSFIIRLYEDRIPAGHAPVYLPRMPRSVYVVQGGITVEFSDGTQHQRQESAWVGQDPIALVAGEEDAVLWRWELVAPDAPAGTLRSAPGATSTLKLQQEIELDSQFDWLMRCDRVDFPPGGVALTHVHQGPGIRCCLKGEITIETQGKTTVHPAGSAWFELGHAPVLAPTTEATDTSFIRCFILPQGCRLRSSLRYVLPEDAGKPKRQHYHVYGERMLTLP
ncbi:hypothetical protein [Pigmentiphaga daeguensis]|uniref:Cupin domain-containing protein n=1 Tax=Pigmentiphaga daeguensis TaxID=414049 RepID=A0ABN1C329_9BURK